MSMASVMPRLSVMLFHFMRPGHLLDDELTLWAAGLVLNDFVLAAEPGALAERADDLPLELDAEPCT